RAQIVDFVRKHAGLLHAEARNIIHDAFAGIRKKQVSDGSPDCSGRQQEGHLIGISHTSAFPFRWFLYLLTKGFTASLLPAAFSSDEWSSASLRRIHPRE